ncbi:hypothetical protein MOP88_04155 [Sphingomonas sp. WKB10]|nr:hypothetical protein [Sphingomonas sp. WKB10]
MFATLPMIAASVPAGAAISSDVARWEAGLRDLAEAERVLALARVDDDAARAAKAAGKPDGSHLDWEGLDGILPVRGHYERIDIARVRADTLMHIERGYWRHDPKHPSDASRRSISWRRIAMPCGQTMSATPRDRPRRRIGMTRRSLRPTRAKSG